MLEDFPSHLPFIDERTLAASEECYLPVQKDPVYGLRVPARSGYVKNDGPGDITIRTSDNGERWSKAAVVKRGENFTCEHDDDVWIHSVYIVADASGAAFRSRFARRGTE